MLSVDLGAVVPLSWTSTASGSATVIVTGPDGLPRSTSAVNNAANVHTATFTPDMAGRFLISWAQASDAEAYTDVVNVWPADPRFLISLAEARDSIRNGSTSDDDTMRLYIAAATPVIEDIAGPILLASRSQTASGDAPLVLLGDSPVSTVVVSVDGNPPIAANLLDINTNAGIVTALGGSFGGIRVTVTYKVGTGVVPPNVRRGTAELVRFWIQIGRQGARPTSVAQDSAMAWTPSGFAVPKRVIELCAPNARLGGFG